VIQVGADADIVLVDLARRWTLDDSKLQSRSKISPWNSRDVCGLPIHTLVRGRFAMKNRTLMPNTKGWGRSVHVIQEMPPAVVKHPDQTLQTVLKAPAREPAG
jgi:dihydroorotase